MLRKVPRGRDFREVPQFKARPRAQPLAAYARAHPESDRAIAAAYASGAYTMQGDRRLLWLALLTSQQDRSSEARREAKGKA
jgi:hypothetical protein